MRVFKFWKGIQVKIYMEWLQSCINWKKTLYKEKTREKLIIPSSVYFLTSFWSILAPHPTPIWKELWNKIDNKIDIVRTRIKNFLVPRCHPRELPDCRGGHSVFRASPTFPSMLLMDRWRQHCGVEISAEKNKERRKWDEREIRPL